MQLSRRLTYTIVITIFVRRQLFHTSQRPQNKFWHNFTGRQYSTSSTKSVFFKSRFVNKDWPQRLLRSLCFLRADSSTKMAYLASDWLIYFRLIVCILWTDFKRNLIGSKNSTSSTKFVFWADLLAEMASDWLKQFRLLCNCWADFHEMWREASTQCPLSSLCLSYPSVNKDGRPGLWLAEESLTSSATAEQILMKLDRKKVLNVLYQFGVFASWSVNKDSLHGIS